MQELVKKQLSNIPKICNDDYQLLKLRVKEFAIMREISEEEQKRLSEELFVVKKYGLSKLFLLYQNVPFMFANYTGVECCSYINYLVRVTDVNPVKYNLPFERFFNWKKRYLPSFTLHVKKSFMEHFILELYERFGEDHLYRPCDNPNAYYISAEPFEEKYIQESIETNENDVRNRYGSICKFTENQLIQLGYYGFNVLEDEDMEVSDDNSKIEQEQDDWLDIEEIETCNINSSKQEQDVFKKAKEMYPNLPAEQFLEMQEVKEILAETDYRLIFQEQLMEILHKVCGMSKAYADYYRLEIGKGKRASLSRIRKKLVQKYGEEGIKLFEYIEKYSKYTICKSYVLANMDLDN